MSCEQHNTSPLAPGKVLVGRVLTIDHKSLHIIKHDAWHGICKSEACRDVTRQRHWRERVDFLMGDSVSATTVEKVHEYVRRFKAEFQRREGREAQVESWPFFPSPSAAAAPATAPARIRGAEGA